MRRLLISSFGVFDELRDAVVDAVLNGVLVCASVSERCESYTSCDRRTLHAEKRTGRSGEARVKLLNHGRSDRIGEQAVDRLTDLCEQSAMPEASEWRQTAHHLLEVSEQVVKGDKVELAFEMRVFGEMPVRCLHQ